MILLKISLARAKKISTQLLAWFAANKRDLPWRRDAHDPYRVWISETLLQQTQVATVIPYYERFLARFPTVESLASAPLDDVLKAWEGAGYYARARNLHRAAQEIVSQFNGSIPDLVEDLLSLPGIGRYTAGAVASIAYHRDAPVLDGNVIRVLCRYFRIESDSKAKPTQDLLWDLMTKLLPRGSAGDFNQAMMELGATICTPRNPQCVACPLKRGCVAKRAGVQDKLPIKAKKKVLPHHEIAVGVVWKRDKLLIARRKDEAMLGGLWEFPGGHREKRESLEACVAREVREELGIEVAVAEKFAEVEHAYSHFSITLHAFHCRWVSGRPRAIGCAAWKWIEPSELNQYAFPKANRVVIEKIGKPVNVNKKTGPYR
jgi:A/G-specific adenine glycosylase